MTKLDTMFPLSFSYSSLSSFWSCELKGFRASIQHLRPPNDNPDLLAGGAFAKACELARKGYYNEGLSQEEAIEIGKAYILASPDTGHAIKTNERVAYSFEKYIEVFPFNQECKPCVLEDGSHAIEYKFEIDTGIPHPDFPDRNILFTGISDGLYGLYEVSSKKRIETYIIDEKTTSRIYRLPGAKVVDLEKEANVFRASSQLIGYCVVAEMLGIKVDAALIRRIPILKTYEPAYELEIPITQFMKDRWAISTFSKIESLKQKYLLYKENKGTYPQQFFYPTYGNSCNAYARPCPYIEGCLTKDGEQLLSTIYEQKVSKVNENGERESVPLAEFKKLLKSGKE